MKIARRLARGVFELNTPGRIVAESRLRDAFSSSGTDPLAVQPTIAAMYEHLARFWVEILFSNRLMRSDRWRQYVRIENEDLIQSLAARQRGCILVSSYLGNPAMCAFALGQIFRPIHLLMDLDALPAVRSWMGYFRRVPNVMLIERAAASRELPEILRRGGAVWTIGEHNRPSGHAIDSVFLGRRIRAYPTVERLAHWYEVPVAVVNCLRSALANGHEQMFHFTLCCHEIQAEYKEESTRAVLMKLEEAIMTHPEQYLWNVPTTPTASIQGLRSLKSRSRNRQLVQA